MCLRARAGSRALPARSVRRAGYTSAHRDTVSALASDHLANLILDALEPLAQRRRATVEIVLADAAPAEDPRDVAPRQAAIDAQHQERAIVRIQGLAQRGDSILHLGAMVRERRGANAVRGR